MAFSDLSSLLLRVLPGRPDDPFTEQLTDLFDLAPGVLHTISYSEELG